MGSRSRDTWYHLDNVTNEFKNKMVCFFSSLKSLRRVKDLHRQAPTISAEPPRGAGHLIATLELSLREGGLRSERSSSQTTAEPRCSLAFGIRVKHTAFPSRLSLWRIRWQQVTHAHTFKQWKLHAHTNQQAPWWVLRHVCAGSLCKQGSRDIWLAIKSTSYSCVLLLFMSK